MARSPENIKDRISGAYLVFHTVQSEDLPQDLREKYDDLKNKLKSEGSVNASLDAMSEQEARDLIGAIVDLNHEIIIANEKAK